MTDPLTFIAASATIIGVLYTIITFHLKDSNNKKIIAIFSNLKKSNIITSLLAATIILILIFFYLNKSDQSPRKNALIHLESKKYKETLASIENLNLTSIATKALNARENLIFLGSEEAKNKNIDLSVNLSIRKIENNYYNGKTKILLTLMLEVFDTNTSKKLLSIQQTSDRVDVSDPTSLTPNEIDLAVSNVLQNIGKKNTVKTFFKTYE